MRTIDTTSLTAETVAQIRLSDVSALAVDVERRGELVDLQRTLMEMLRGVAVPSLEWSAIVAPLLASVDALLWSKINRSSAIVNKKLADHAHQLAVTRLLESLKNWAEGTGEDPVEYLTEYTEYAFRTARSQLGKDASLREELILDSEAEVELGFRSASAPFETPETQSMLHVAEKACSMAAELSLREKVVVSSPAAFWAIRNAKAFDSVADSADVLAFIR